MFLLFELFKAWRSYKVGSYNEKNVYTWNVTYLLRKYVTILHSVISHEDEDVR